MHTHSIVSRACLLLAGSLVLTATSLSSAPAGPPAEYGALAPCGSLSFNSPVDYGVGTEPQGLGVGDLDSDGDDDVVAPNYSAATLTVRLSTPTGFVAAPGAPVALPGSPWLARIGDFTGDNVADVATFAGHDVIVVAGNGDGTFSSQTVTNVSATLTNQGGTLTGGANFAVADLNGDLKLDVVFAATNAGKAAVWLGTGNGAFALAQSFQVGTAAVPVAIGDINGDARPDFAIGDSYADTSATGSFVYVFVQQVDGTFAAPVSYEAYKSVRSLALADLDGDLKPDLIAPDYYGHGYHAFGGDDLGRVSIFFGNGDGTFGSPIHPLTGADNPGSVEVEDFDGDGDLDIATSNAFQRTAPGGFGRISILLGDGAGGFAAPILFPTSVGNHPSALTSGDFDGDLMPDLAWVSDYQNPSPTMKVMVNATDCDRTPPVITPLVSGTLGGNGWYTSDVYLEWNVSDPESTFSTTGCGFASITGDVAGLLFTCEATSEGGTSSQSVNIKRDATPPIASASAGPPPNASGWRKTNVTVIFAGVDALSGGVTCSPQVVFSAEGISQSTTGYCYDAAGNQSAAVVVSDINIDKTSPAITVNIPTSGAVFNRNQVVVANYSCSDSLSTVASCSGTVASGQPLDTSKKANNAKFTVTATDRAGNTAKTTVTYTVR